ncbi:MAG: DUF5711 family protein [Oscillospiraceae bacterium]|nr:DUF5711 family protein [Oscillospiraceae bacterium]
MKTNSRATKSGLPPNEDDTRAAPRLRREERRKRRCRRRRTVGGVFVLLVAVCVGLVIILGGELSASGMRAAIVRVTGKTAREMTLIAGYDRAFADLRFAVVSAGASGVAVTDLSGETVAHQAISLSEAAVTSNGKLAAAYTVGGSDVVLADRHGIGARILTESKILAVSVADGGYVAVTTAEIDGYRGVVTLYRVRGDSVEVKFRWRAGTGFPFAAAASSDGKYLATLSLGSSGGRIVVFRTSSENPIAEVTYPETIVELAFIDGDTIIARTRTKLLRITVNGAVTELYASEGEITGYAVGSNYAAVAETGYDGLTNLVTVMSDGAVNYASITFERPVSLRTANGAITLLTDTTLYVFGNAKLTRFTEYDAPNSLDAFPRGGDNAIAFGERGARVFG